MWIAVTLTTAPEVPKFMNFGTVEAPKKILKGDVQKSPGHGLLKNVLPLGGPWRISDQGVLPWNRRNFQSQRHLWSASAGDPAPRAEGNRDI